MENLKNFNDYDPQNEGLKSMIATGLLSLLSFGSFGKGNVKQAAKTDNAKEITTTRDFGDNEEYKQSEIKRLLKNGWKQSSMEIDTLWENTVQSAPDTVVRAMSIKIGGNQFFKSGDYQLSDSVKREIDNVLQEVIDNDGIITNIVVSASTDKQGLSPRLKKELQKKGYDTSNAGLSKLRADGVKGYMVDGAMVDGAKSPINDSLVKVETFSNQGDTIDATKRYVKVDVQFIVNPKQSGTEQERKFKTKTTYKFTKTANDDKGGPDKIYKKSSYKYKSPVKRFGFGKIFKHKNRSLNCPKW